jgi:glycosyltransferase involved in cell wall biosynthesis
LHTLQVPAAFSGKVSQIYPGIDLGHLSPGNGHRPALEGGAIGATPPPRVLFAGRLNWTKGLHVLLVALSIVHHHWKCPASLWVAGGGDANPYRKLARELGLEKHVEFLGPLSQLDVRQKMRLANLFCFPSLLSPNWMEQYGFALVEAMAHGLPVVAFDSGSVREICGEDGVYASAGNAYELAKGIAHLLSDKMQASRSGERLQRRTFELFDAELQGRKMLEFIQ